MRSRVPKLWWTAAFGVFAALRIAVVAGRRVERFNDTVGYLHLSFIGHGRPWVVPLFYEVLDADGARVAAQCAISIVCWCLLAYVAAQVMHRTWLQVVVAGGVLVIGVSPQVTLWDLTLLSESLSLSLTAAAIASWILFATRATRMRMVAVWVVTLLWAFTRTSNLVVLPVVLLLLAASLAWRSNRRARVLLLVALAPIAVWGFVTVRNDPATTEYNTYAIIELRMFGHVERTRYLAQHGMPVSADIVRFRGIVPRDLVPRGLVRYARIPAGLNVPELVVTGGRPLVRWMRDKGPATYLKWLAAHPGYTLTEPLKNLDDLVAPKLETITPPVDSREVMPDFVTSVLFESRGVYLVAFAAALCSALAAVLLKLSSRTLAVAWCVLGVSVALVYVSWLGAAIELGRHAIVASVASRLGILMILTFTADLYLTARRDVVVSEGSS